MKDETIEVYRFCFVLFLGDLSVFVDRPVSYNLDLVLCVRDMSPSILLAPSHSLPNYLFDHGPWNDCTAQIYVHTTEREKGRNQKGSIKVMSVILFWCHA